MNNSGVIYTVTGEQYIEEARRSAASVKTHMPELPITVFSDQKFESKYVDRVEILQNSRKDYGDSIIKPKMSPYDRTLFLDSDTHICDDITDVFTLLDEFNIAVAHNPIRREDLSSLHYSYRSRGVPDSFPMYNTGVVAFKKDNAIDKLFSRWIDIYNNRISEDSDGYKFNQPAFREALYNSKIRVATLPPEYNCRIGRPGFVHGPVKIIHSRHPDMDSAKRELNQNINMRVHIRKGWPLKVKEHNPSVYNLIRGSIKRRGVKDTFYKGIKRLIT